MNSPLDQKPSLVILNMTYGLPFVNMTTSPGRYFGPLRVRKMDSMAWAIVMSASEKLFITNTYKLVG